MNEPFRYKSPTYCHGDRCSQKETCIRYKDKGLFKSIYVPSCTRYGHLFKIVEGSEEAKEFERQAYLYNKEQNPFSIDWDRAKVPTNDTMYDCFFCKRDGKEHTIESKSTPDHLRDKTSPASILNWHSTIRVCSGCGRYDGPWVPYGDDY